VPQYTLVGNAIPPLLARAVASEILKHIKWENLQKKNKKR
jgi:DNA (cytosine-5)-methyltransferase 1